jgi:hypothetical protein
MVLRFDDLGKDLDRVFMEMVSKKLEVGTVAVLGTGTEPLGEYFSEKFGCKKVKIPSVMRKGRNKRLAHILNSAYPYLPELALNILSQGYKRLYSRSDRIIPEFPIDYLFEDNGLPILLTDDNCFTGKSLSLWKDMIENKTKREVKTFSITVTGDYFPDYFCYRGWRSFEWRPIGI